MKELLISILQMFVGDNVFLQGTMNPDETYPAKFATFFVNSSPFDGFHDDEASKIDWSIAVMFYSNNPIEVLTVPPQIVRALKGAGFIPLNAGVDVISDVETHTGWAMDFRYIEKYE